MALRGMRSSRAKVWDPVIPYVSSRFEHRRCIGRVGAYMDVRDVAQPFAFERQEGLERPPCFVPKDFVLVSAEDVAGLGVVGKVVQ